MHSLSSDPTQGLEPRYTASEAAVLPLDDLGMDRREGVEPSPDRFKACCPTVRRPTNMVVPINPVTTNRSRGSGGNRTPAGLLIPWRFSRASHKPTDVCSMVGSEGLEPPKSNDNRFTVWSRCRLSNYPWYILRESNPPCRIESPAS